MVFEINTSAYEKLERSFYERSDVTLIAKELLGKYLFTDLSGGLVAGRIVETEAYCGRGDKACHANNKRTPRTEIMYGNGGFSYIYLCYGIHHLFNVVTNTEGLADAVLVRAIEPAIGLDLMKARRKEKTNLGSGPGILSEAMSLKKEFSGTDLLGDQIWIAKGPEEVFEIEEDVRIGVEYAEEDAMKPWRYFVKGNKYVSRKKVG